MARRTRPRRDAAWNPPAKGGDVTGLFAMLVSVPLLLPLLSHYSFLAFVLPFASCTLATPRCLAAARGRPSPSAWAAFAAGTALAAVASALAATSQAYDALTKPAFYVGAAASCCLLAGAAIGARRVLPRLSAARAVDALLLDAVVVAMAAWFVAKPAFEHGDVVLATVFLIDLAALAIACASTISMPAGPVKRTGWSLAAALAFVAAGDGFVALGDGSPAVTAACWAAAGALIFIAPRLAEGAPDEPSGDDGVRRFVTLRVVMPLVATLSFPAIAGGLAANHALTVGAAIYFVTFFAATLVLAFGRQAWLLVDHRRAALRERQLRREVVRRNGDLEALTALAATLTETLEEAPVIERGLAALRIAARATSLALHLRSDGGLKLAASAGEWGLEAPWAARGAPASWIEGVERSGGRQIVRLRAAARGNDIGLVTLVRREREPVSDEERQLLQLLVAQVAIAIQNARDYSDRREQAIRDPLTGLHNRRFFYEALHTEVQRAERYSTPVALVLLDLDDFKLVNDTLGHLAGDAVLTRIARIAAHTLRPSDHCARVGGEEFALMLPETSRLEALIVAERVRRTVAIAEMPSDRKVTVSAGIASYPEDAATIETLESKADAALYWAKRNGKNLCAVATEVVVADGDSESNEALSHLHAIVATIDGQPLNTREHSQNVAAYAEAIGRHLGLSEDRAVA